LKPIQAQESSESDTSVESSAESDSEPEENSPVGTSGKPPKHNQTHRASPSPSPPPTKLPTFLPETSSGENDTVVQEQLMKDRFRKFWMASIADGFRDDLEEIRKVCFSTPCRIGVL
jgi:ribosome assembly protein 3